MLDDALIKERLYLKDDRDLFYTFGMCVSVTSKSWGMLRVEKK